MISDIRYWEKKASEGHYAIPHFNVWNAEMLMGVIDAAEELRAPIIISFGTGFTEILLLRLLLYDGIYGRKSKCSGNSSLGSRPQYDDPSKP